MYVRIHFQLDSVMSLHVQAVVYACTSQSRPVSRPRSRAPAPNTGDGTVAAGGPTRPHVSDLRFTLKHPRGASIIHLRAPTPPLSRLLTAATSDRIHATMRAIPMAVSNGALTVAALLLLAASSVADYSGEGAEGTRKVDVALYYESLCPYSAQFVVDRLAKVFDNGLLDAVDLTLVPYGNARVGPGGKISCQHGPYECLLNTVEACAIDAWPDLDVHFRFIYCVEDLVVKHQYRDWESCFQKLGLDPKPVTECYKSEHGHKLELKYAKQTDSLQPPHRYVPWVVVDGQPLLEDYENFEAYICKAYKGNRPPEVCKGVGRPQMVLETVEARNGVSYNSGSIKLEPAEDESGESVA